MIWAATARGTVVVRPLIGEDTLQHRVLITMCSEALERQSCGTYEEGVRYDLAGLHFNHAEFMVTPRMRAGIAGNNVYTKAQKPSISRRVELCLLGECCIC